MTKKTEGLLALGRAFHEIINGDSFTVNESLQTKLSEVSQHAMPINPWYTPDNVTYAMKQWAELLNEDAVNAWLAAYPPIDKAKRIGLITAGNIPLVGLHDIISVWAAGHVALIKSATEDPLTPVIVDLLNYIAKEERFVSHNHLLKGADAYIATGSDNSARYFDYYFGKYPHIIRKNRHSVAILRGDESSDELRGLASDIFRYFGLGCRSVSKIFIPAGYDFQPLFKAMVDFQHVIEHNRYANNYDYYRTIYLMNKQPIWDNGFIVFKEDEGLSSPVAVLFYSTYENETELQRHIESMGDKLQCVVGKNNLDFGSTQQPSLTDYADGVDTMRFLTSSAQW
ncbi:MAG: acyl-CoA reductase [Cryomorphaceae bacterium]|nr:acyl-CoA reductase [Cryomorphaceae bacterium]